MENLQFQLKFRQDESMQSLEIYFQANGRFFTLHHEDKLMPPALKDSSQDSVKLESMEIDDSQPPEQENSVPMEIDVEKPEIME